MRPPSRHKWGRTFFPKEDSLHKISATSALVLLWTDRSVYQGGMAKRFLDGVDLEAGRPLSDRIHQISNISKIEVTNRKFAVGKFCDRFLESVPDAQVVFLASGLDPRSIDVAERHPRCSVYDIDSENMDVKERLGREIGGPRNIAFCPGDVSNAPEILRGRGWDPGRATLVVAEGITYYVPKRAFREILSRLVTPSGGLILEYSVPEDLVDEENRPPYTEYFVVARELLGLPDPLLRYTPAEVESLADLIGGRISETLDQRKVEAERTGANDLYSGTNPGVIWVSYILFP